MYQQKVIKHGNSLAVVIPAIVCNYYDIKRGDFCILQTTIDGDLLVKRYDPNKRPDLLEVGEIEISDDQDDG